MSGIIRNKVREMQYLQRVTVLISKQRSSGSNKMTEFKFDIKENVGIIFESAQGWTKELNLVSWNGRDPKYDLREWDPTHEKMGKGMTLTNEEIKKLRDFLNQLEL